MMNPTGIPGESATSPWAWAFRTVSVVGAHFTVLVVALAAIGGGGVAAWGVGQAVERITGIHDPLAQSIRLGGDVLIIVVISVLSVLHAGQEVITAWRITRRPPADI
jgi:ribosomal protein S5